MRQLQQFSSLKLIVKQAFGGTTAVEGDPENNPDVPQTFDEAVLRFNALFN